MTPAQLSSAEGSSGTLGEGLKTSDLKEPGGAPVEAAGGTSPSALPAQQSQLPAAVTEPDQGTCADDRQILLTAGGGQQSSSGPFGFWPFINGP